MLQLAVSISVKMLLWHKYQGKKAISTPLFVSIEKGFQECSSEVLQMLNLVCLLSDLRDGSHLLTCV